jgi:hypothetical protein
LPVAAARAFIAAGAASSPTKASRLFINSPPFTAIVYANM